VILVQQEAQEQMAKQERLDLSVLQEAQVRLEQLVKLELKEMLEQLDQQEALEQLDNKEI
jgi:hypothetical protein